MGKINMGRVVMGGVLAGVVLFFTEFVLHGVILSADWKQAMTALGKTMNENMAGEMVIYAVWSLVLGIASVWLYAAMRPRFGAGPGTAVKTGLAAWVIGCVGPTMSQAAMGLFPAKLLWASVGGEFVIFLVATVAGAWLYQEAAAA